MNPSKRGLGAAGKAGAVVVLIIIVLGAIYLIPKFSASSQSQASSSNPGARQLTGLNALFYGFTKMQVSIYASDQVNGVLQNQSYAYSVLGKGTLNSTEYTRVEYTTVGLGENVVVWYNSTGGIGEVDVVGVRNYTGNGAGNLPFITIYSNAFGTLASIGNNATLLSLLSKTSEGQVSMGPTQLDVSTYQLTRRSYPFSSLTLGLATVPGTNAQLATYLDEKTTDGSTSILQVTSLTR